MWLWWQGVPALYPSTQLAPGTKLTAADQLKAITDTRTTVLAGLAAVGALGTFWATLGRSGLRPKPCGSPRETSS